MLGIVFDISFIVSGITLYFFIHISSITLVSSKVLNQKYQSRKISCFNLTVFSSKIQHKNALCVAGSCRRDIATETQRKCVALCVS